MKIRNGFVSNSSSSSFIFFLKEGGVKELIDIVKEQAPNVFDLSYIDYSGSFYQITTNEVLDTIAAVEERVAKDGEAIDANIDELIADTEENRDYWKEESIKEKKGSYVHDFLKEYEEKLAKFKDLKQNGFTRTVTIGFGDNHGHVCGGRIGNSMDYEGRNVKIDLPELKLAVEQDR